MRTITNNSQFTTMTTTVDWDEWDDPSPVLPSAGKEKERGEPWVVSLAASPERDEQQQQQEELQQLRRLVHECSQRLELPGIRCGDDNMAVLDDNFRVPFFYSQPSCGFEVGSFVSSCVKSGNNPSCCRTAVPAIHQFTCLCIRLLSRLLT